jgi:hypothetical protein
MTPEGQQRQRSLKNTYLQYTGFDAASELGPYDRCISRGLLGSMFPVVYNNGNQFIQTPGYVVLRNEMIHETRVIPLDGRPALSPRIRTYMGDSRGHFEGNTLVVRTTNFNGGTGAQANGNLMITSDALEVVEKFTRPNKGTLHYEALIDDPGAYAKLHNQWPGTGEVGSRELAQLVASQGGSYGNGPGTGQDPQHLVWRQRGAELLDKIGPAIIMTHSAGGPFGYLVAEARPKLVKGIIVVEGAGVPFAQNNRWGLSSVPVSLVSKSTMLRSASVRLPICLARVSISAWPGVTSIVAVLPTTTR